MNPLGRTPGSRSSWHPGTAAFVLAAVAATVTLAGDEGTPADHARSMARGLEAFKKDVREILVKNCLDCHGGKATKGEFDLTTREGLLREGTQGPNLVPGKATESRMYRMVAHQIKPAMPHKAAKLPDSQVRAIAAWIDSGAPYDRPLAAGAAEKKDRGAVTEADREFWSFRPLDRPEPPKVKDDAWCRTPVDRFVLAKLESKGLKPNQSAPRRTLIRRATFDLTGLPPTAEEIDAFEADASPDAYQRLIDRLLASPRHGERWARHWLDLARYAESHGYEQDYDRPFAYHFRDFLIRALNEDMPYDRFVRLQVAGDEFEPDNPEAMTATGFLGAGTHATQITANQVEKERYDELDDMAATTGTAFLGLTVGCARCHDHKFDPIPTADYYRLVATFTTTVRSEIDLDLDPDSTRKAKAEYDRRGAALDAERVKFERQTLPVRVDAWLKSNPRLPRLTASPVSLVFRAVESVLSIPDSRRTPAQNSLLGAWYRSTDMEWLDIVRRAREHTADPPKPKNTLKAMVTSEGFPAIRFHTQGADFFDKTYLLKRGDLAQKQGEATSGVLTVLNRAPDGEPRWKATPPNGWRTSYRRTGLANWMTDVDYGAGQLLARVIVNRLWQHHFGRGIVATPSDFGAQGERPTHPELLDWLAGELIRGGWRLKPIHKLMMTSAVYMQTADDDPARSRIDRENTLCWKRPHRRLEAEAIRDAMLAVSGTLDPTMYGPGTLDEGMRRRSIYFQIKRSQLIPLMILFDAPDSLVGIGKRSSTTVAPQALALMNNPNVRGYAAGLAARVEPKAKDSPAEAIRSAYRLALGRPPEPVEMVAALDFVLVQSERYRTDGHAAALSLSFADFCQSLMCLNEFAYVD
jgi:mono/diheme cytochrome c family protein